VCKSNLILVDVQDHPSYRRSLVYNY